MPMYSLSGKISTWVVIEYSGGSVGSRFHCILPLFTRGPIKWGLLTRLYIEVWFIRRLAVHRSIGSNRLNPIELLVLGACNRRLQQNIQATKRQFILNHVDSNFSHLLRRTRNSAGGRCAGLCRLYIRVDDSNVTAY